MTLQDEVKKFNIAISRIGGLYQKFEQQCGRNILQVRVLCVLYFDKLQTQRQICDMLELPKQTVNNIITALIKQGYIDVVADECDRRAKIIRLNESGIRYAEAELQPFNDFDAKVAERMGIEAYKMLVALTEAQADAYEQELQLWKKKKEQKEQE